jgi:hypothetical protein
VTAGFNELSLLGELARLPYKEWAARVKGAVGDEGDCARFTLKGTSMCKDLALKCGDDGGSGPLLAVLAVLRPS